MRTVIVSLWTLALICHGASALAGERLWPTAIRTGECSSAHIYVLKSAFHDSLDKNYCIDRNLGNSEKIVECLNNSRTRRGVPFFTDRCGSESFPFFISLNEIEYELHLVDRDRHSPVYFSGRYSGQGLEVEIQGGSLLRRVYDRAEKEVVAEEYRVTVKVTKGTHTEEISGIFFQGR